MFFISFFFFFLQSKHIVKTLLKYLMKENISWEESKVMFSVDLLSYLFTLSELYQASRLHLQYHLMIGPVIYGFRTPPSISVISGRAAWVMWRCAGNSSTRATGFSAQPPHLLIPPSDVLACRKPILVLELSSKSSNHSVGHPQFITPSDEKVNILWM